MTWRQVLESVAIGLGMGFVGGVVIFGLFGRWR